MDVVLQAIPGVVVVLLGVLIIVGRRLVGAGSTIARIGVTGRPATESERRGDSFMPIVIGAGVVLAGFWLLVYTYVLR